MAQDLVNLDAFKAGPAQAFKGLDPHSENLADGIGQSYGIINYKGKVWSLRYRGERKTFIRPDDGTPSSFIDVVILQSPGNKSKSYFKDYVDGSDEGPLCSSIDGIKPDAGVRVAQSTDCATCPRNVWKQNATGRKTRDCQDYKRLAVLITPAQTKPMFDNVALVEPVFLRVPAASLNNLANLGEQMAAMGYHFSSYVTRISFDPAQAHPQMVFKAVKPLSDIEAQKVVLPLRNDPLSLRIIGKEQGLLASPTATSAATPPTTGGTTQTPSAPAPAANSSPTLTTTSTSVAETQPPSTSSSNESNVVPIKPAAAEEVSPSTFDLDAPTPTPAPAQSTVADIGVSETSDAMDAEIAAMMGKVD